MNYSILWDHFLRENLINVYILVLTYGLTVTISNKRTRKENKWNYLGITRFKRCDKPK